MPVEDDSLVVKAETCRVMAQVRHEELVDVENDIFQVQTNVDPGLMPDLDNLPDWEWPHPVNGAVPFEVGFTTASRGTRIDFHHPYWLAAALPLLGWLGWRWIGLLEYSLGDQVLTNDLVIATQFHQHYLYRRHGRFPVTVNAFNYVGLLVKQALCAILANMFGVREHSCQALCGGHEQVNHDSRRGSGCNQSPPNR